TVRPQNGRRRFHPQTVSAAASDRARQSGAAPLLAERRQSAQGGGQQGARARSVAHGSGTPHLYLEKRAGDAHRNRVSDPASPGKPPWRSEKSQRLDGRSL